MKYKPSIHDKDLPVLTKKFGDYSGLLNFLNGSINKTNVLIWCIFMSSSMKAAIHLGAELSGEFGDPQEHELRGD